MKISLISDVHVKNLPDDIGQKCLDHFLNHKNVEASDVIIFLGDVFDLLVGSYKEYEQTYKNFFSKIDQFIKLNKKVYFFEGNHDFLCHELFLKRSHKSLVYSKSFMVIENNGKNILLNHGDEVEIGNYSYRLLKSALNNTLTKKILDVLSYKYLNMIGQKWSGHSRKTNTAKYNNEEQQLKIKSHYRVSAKKALELFNAEILVCGHGHVQDIYIFENKKIYSNNGYVPNTKIFTYIDDENNVCHISLF